MSMVLGLNVTMYLKLFLIHPKCVLNVDIIQKVYLINAFVPMVYMLSIFNMYKCKNSRRTASSTGVYTLFYSLLFV